MQPKTVIRYSAAFKQQVVADLEAGRFRTILAASEHYGIRGAMTVRRWLKRHGKNHLMAKVVRVEKPDEADQIRQLKKQIRQLQEVLGKTQMKSVMNESFLEIACEQLGVDVEEFKKKCPQRGPPIPGTDRAVGEGPVPGCGDDAAELLQGALPPDASAGGGGVDRAVDLPGAGGAAAIGRAEVASHGSWGVGQGGGEHRAGPVL